MWSLVHPHFYIYKVNECLFKEGVKDSTEKRNQPQVDENVQNDRTKFEWYLSETTQFSAIELKSVSFGMTADQQLFLYIKLGMEPTPVHIIKA